MRAADCPHCGKEQGYDYLGKWFSATIYLHEDGRHVVHCLKCECAGPPSTTQRGAIQRWNRRAVPADQP